jgi:prepilin peptidase CpaA
MSVELLAAAVASVAAVIDVRWRRIPNWLTLAALGSGLLVQVMRYGLAGLVIALGGAALGLAVFGPLYLMRAIGAGDVKLIAALGAILGPQSLVGVLIYCAIAGGVMSAVLLARKGLLQSSFANLLINPLHISRSGAKAPYGVAIASGVYLSMLLPSVIG